MKFTLQIYATFTSNLWHPGCWDARVLKLWVTVCFCDSRELATENHYVELCGTVKIAYGRKPRSISIYSWSYVGLFRLHTVGTSAVYRIINGVMWYCPCCIGEEPAQYMGLSIGD